MDIAAQQGYQGDRKLERSSAKAVAGGSIAELTIAAGAITLSVLGIIGVLPILFLSIGAICIGASFLLESSSMASLTNSMFHDATGNSANASELGGGITIEFIAGLAGVTLGVLAIFGIMPVTLVSIAAIAFGAALVLGSSSTAQINSISFSKYTQSQLARDLMSGSAASLAGIQLVVGIGAVILGVLALLEIQPVLFSLISILSVGSAILLSGTSTTGKMVRQFK